MAINFDNVPKDNPFKLPPKGIYRARILEAKMTASKTPGKPPYLELTYMLLDSQGRSIAKMRDRLFDSTHNVVLYKIGRLVSAIGLQLTGSMELKDLAKVLPNKMLCIDVTHEADDREPDNRDKDKAVPRIFGSEVFWPISEAERLIPVEGTGVAAETPEAPINPADVPFDMSNDTAASLANEIAAAVGTPAGDDNDY